MAGHSNSDALADSFVGCIVCLVLLLIAFILFVTVTSSIGLYLLGWGITYGILWWADKMTNGAVSDNGFWALGVAALFWAGLVRIFADTVSLWVWDNFNIILPMTWLVAIAGLIGLSWGVLSIFLIEQQHTTPGQIEGSGLYQLREDEDKADSFDPVWPTSLTEERLVIGDDF